MSGEGDWTSVGDAANRQLILTAWKAGKLEADVAWELLNRHGAFRSKTLALMAQDVGMKTIDAMFELAAVEDDDWRLAALILILRGVERGHISPQTEEFLKELFSVGLGVTQ